MSDSSLRDRLAAVVADLMRADARRVLLGEDVADGGMLGLSRAVMKDAGLRARVCPTPLTPTVLAAHAAGLAAAGHHPVVVLPGVEALLEGLAGLREAANWSWRTGGEVPVPLCLLAPCGSGLGRGGMASEAMASMLTLVPGLTVLCAGRAEEAGAWVRAAVEHAANAGPTVLLLPRRLLLGASPRAPSEDLGRPPTAAHRVREGDALTVFAWGEALPVALAAVDLAGVEAAVVDVGCLAPLDHLRLEDEARATGRLVIVHPGPGPGGVAAELAARFADAAILHLDAPVVRVGGAEPPLSPSHEAAATPRVERVAEAITRIARY